jgi:hypothetical protein
MPTGKTYQASTRSNILDKCIAELELKGYRGFSTVPVSTNPIKIKRKKKETI